MNHKTTSFFLLLMVCVLALAACGGNGEETATAAPDLTEIPLVEDTYSVIAEGRIVPDRYVNLTFSNGGIVAEVLVENGQQVEKGDMLAHLRAEDLESAMAAAELEFVQARQAYEDFDRNLDLLTAEAASELAEAQDAVRDAEQKVDNLVYGAKQANLDSAEAQVILLREKLEDAQEDFDKHGKKPPNNLERASYQAVLAEAQLAYDDAVRLLNNMQAGSNPVDLALAQSELEIAEAQLAIAERDYSLWEDGPHPDDLETAEARMNAANTAYKAAKAAYEDAFLKAPFDGVVAAMDLRVGDLVSPGTVGAVVADFSSWVVETDNLTEIEAPRVRVGQKVEVVADALPDVTLKGTVKNIRQLYEEKRGDITYTVEIELDEHNPDLLWGMTVVINFLEE